MYCLVVIDDYSKFTWVFFLSTKDETSGILKSFIRGIENLVDHKVKIIRCDNRTEFKNREMNQFCELKGSGPDRLFDIDARTRTIKYEPIAASTQSNSFVGTKACDNAGQARKETKPVKDYILQPLWTADLLFFQDPKSSQDNGFKPSCDDGKKLMKIQVKKVNAKIKSRNIIKVPFDLEMPALEDISTFNFSSDHEDDGAEADINNMNTTIQFSPIPTTRIHKDHPLDQKNDGIFISQDKYVGKILKKFWFTEVKNASTPMETQNPLLKDEDGEEVDVHLYRSMIGSLMYLTSSRPDIMFSVCACPRYQVNPKVSHLYAVKRIFSSSLLLRQKPSMGKGRYMPSTVASAIICLAINQKFNFSKWIFDSMGRNLDNNSGKFLMYPRFIQVFLDKQIYGLLNHERKYISPSNTKKIFRNMKRFGKGFFGRITLLFPTLVVQSQSGEGSPIPTDPQHTPIILQSSSSQPQKTHKLRKPKRKDTQVPQLSVSIKSVADEAVYKELKDRLVRVSTTASILEVEQDSEKTKTSQSNEIESLKKRVKKLEKKQRSRTHKLKRLYMVGLIVRVDSSEDEQNLGNDASKQERKINDIDANEDITLVNDQDDEQMFDVNYLHGEEVFVKEEVANKEVNDEAQKVVDKLIIDAAQDNAPGEVNAASIATTVSAAATITTDEITLAQAPAALKTSKPKIKGIVIHEQEEPSESTTTTTKIISLKKSQDKGKGIMVEEPVKLKKKDQTMLDEEDDVQARIDIDYQLAERLQAEEKEELTDEEKATLFVQLLKKRRKFFAAKRAEEKRNKRPTQAQQRKIMCTYLKNMKGKKLKELKNKFFDSIQKMFDSAFKRVDDEKAKKQKVDDDKEIPELQQLMKIIPDEEEATIDAIPLAVKSLRIVD
nr:putative ribonuclease H-like domain-containing protein [Tanacetum cinerariifolium]